MEKVKFIIIPKTVQSRNAKKTGGKKGFTLIELLIVIAIIGILATIVLTKINAARAKANRAAFMTEANSGVAAFASACDDGMITVPDNSGNVAWTAGADDSCGSGDTFFCEQAMNKKDFPDTLAGGCTLYVGQGGLYTDPDCSIAYDGASSCT